MKDYLQDSRSIYTSTGKEFFQEETLLNHKRYNTEF